LGNCVQLDFGDGTSSSDTPYSSITSLDNNTYQFVYYFDHTFPADNFYKISYFDENRNSNIVNLQSPSNTIPFYIEMGLDIESATDLNQSPQITVLPINSGLMGRTFDYNPTAFDADGDSISYYAFYPQFASGLMAPGYQDPEKPFPGTTQDGLHPATYTVDSITGNIIWDAPAKPGLYNVAFAIEEWRTIGANKVRLSYTILDRQINVLVGFPTDLSNLSISTASNPTIHPNPFQDKTTLDYFRQNEGLVKVEVLDVMGKAIQVHEPMFTNGPNALVLDLSSLASGTYLYRLSSEKEQFIGRMTKK
jgi:hypothetical protein